jgi:hypothetical protein
MTTKKREIVAAPVAKKGTLIPVGDGSKTRSKLKAEAALSPAVNAAVATESYQRSLMGDDIELRDLVDVLKQQSKQVQDGDLSGLEAMLVGQATALQTIFASLVRRAQIQTQPKNLEAFLSLGLKAQTQSRATILALAELKFPRQVAFMKQTNVAHGPQQVNNHAGMMPAREILTGQSKLIEGQTDASTHLDTRTATAPVRSDPAMATVGEVNRATK